MLYQLSYASSQGTHTLFGHANPTDPFRLSGTTVKVTITAPYVQAGPSFILPKSYFGPAPGTILDAMMAFSGWLARISVHLRRSPF